MSAGPVAGPLPGPLLAEIAAAHGTPVWVYDAATIEHQLSRLQAFDVVRYAQKASSNVHLLRRLRRAGALVDAVSGGELERALAAGYVPGGEPAGVVFTADVFDRATLARVLELGIPVNAGSPQMLEQLGERSPGHPVWIRVNPGFGHGHSRKTNTGGEHSKHGIWHTRLADALGLVDRFDLDLVGLHVHIGSGADYHHLERVCDAMIALVQRAGRDVRAISAGGGLAVPYADGEAEIDAARYFTAWDGARREIARALGHPVWLEIEPGRYLTAPAGVLVAEVRAHKRAGAHRFVLVDAGFNDLMRPAMYGARHRVAVLHASDGALRSGGETPAVIAGPLCESGDVFTQDHDGVVLTVPLPEVAVGDLIVFRDAGAYGASMSSNYNSRPLAPEVLVEGGFPRLIRRRQTIEELLALELELD